MKYLTFSLYSKVRHRIYIENFLKKFFRPYSFSYDEKEKIIYMKGVVVCMREVRLPKEFAYMIRNRLRMRGIPYEEIRIDTIAIDQNYVGLIDEIISELRELKKNR